MPQPQLRHTIEAAARRELPIAASENVSQPKAEKVVKPPSTPTMIAEAVFFTDRLWAGEGGGQEADQSATEYVYHKGAEWKATVRGPLHPALDGIAHHRAEGPSGGD